MDDLRLGVLGGGFGLYGWLPAAVGLPGARVATLSRYEPRLRARPELAQFADRVAFVDSIDTLLERSDGLIVARRPSDLGDVASLAIRRAWSGFMVLEKPLGAGPDQALALVQRLSGEGIRGGAGFVMDRTGWGKALVKSLTSDRPDRVDIHWTFLAHHYRHGLSGWKRVAAEGGGALRFFAIHLIALLAHCGEWAAVACSAARDDGEDPSVSFTVRNGTTDVHVHCDSRSAKDPAFTLTAERGGVRLWHSALVDPFSGTELLHADDHPGADRRIPYLAAALRDLAVSGGSPFDALLPHVSIWQRLERLGPRG